MSFSKNVLWLALCSPLAIANNWQSTLFPNFKESEKLILKSEQPLKKGIYPLTFQSGQQCFQPQLPIKLNQTLSLSSCTSDVPTFRVFRDGNYSAQIDLRSGTPTLRLSVEQKEDKPKICPVWNGQAVEIDVKDTFQENEQVRDAYSGQTDIVKNGKVHFLPSSDSNGLLLLEKVEQKTGSKFDWHNATVYFVLTDRFYNGDKTNDHSYGRQYDGLQEIGTFHGGDLKGLTQKLDYLHKLGVNVLWISSPLEQIHGWVGGGEKGDFPHYAYHGYYHQDWTKIDANMGTEQDLQQLIEQAHQRGMRVIFDIVMNHTGYATLADMQEFGFGSLYLKEQEVSQILGEKWTDWKPQTGQNWHSFNNFINFSDKAAWGKWWGKDWTRSDLGDYDSPKFDDLKMSLASLPDLKTEAKQAVKLPIFLANKSDTNAIERDNANVSDYLIGWLSDWVRKYGVDGFRVDTAKHVEKSTWAALKQSAEKALHEWQEKNPTKKFDDKFWMVGEAWGHTIVKSDYFQNGFDAMINFDFQDQAKESLNCFANIEPTYQKMSEKLADFNMLSYLSSHDTRLFFHSDSDRYFDRQKIAANLLMLAPGAVQIYYGDESGREFGATGSDPIQGTRSDMNWDDLKNKFQNQALKSHWQKLVNFRKNHIAVGKGQQIVEQNKSYFAFSRRYQDDKVMVVWVGNRP